MFADIFLGVIGLVLGLVCAVGVVGLIFGGLLWLLGYFSSDDYKQGNRLK